MPRPISSIRTKELGLAALRIAAASVISTINVDRPLARSSLAPIRVKTRSMGPRTQSLAGTKLPMWASITIRAVWRMKVDLPPMFGPVITARRRSSRRTQSLGVNRWPVRSSACSTTGCRPPRISIPGSGSNRGRFQFSVSARSARFSSTSRSATALPSLCKLAIVGWSAAINASQSDFSSANARSLADKARSSNTFSSGVT